MVGHGGPDLPDGEGFAGEFVQDILDGADSWRWPAAGDLPDGPAAGGVVKAIEDAGLPAAHFHDPRHTGNNLTAESGATLRELMDRMGHSSTRAALICLHGSVERQRTVADTMGELAGQMLADDGDAVTSGTDMAQGIDNGS